MKNSNDKGEITMNQFFLVTGQDSVFDLRYDYDKVEVHTPIEILTTELINIGLDIYVVQPNIEPVEVSVGVYFCPSYSIIRKLRWNAEVCKHYLNITTNSFKRLILRLDKQSNVVPINRRRLLDYIKIDYRTDNIHPPEVRAYLHAMRYALAYYESLQSMNEEDRKEVFKKRIVVYKEWQETKLRELLEVA